MTTKLLIFPVVHHSKVAVPLCLIKMNVYISKKGPCFKIIVNYE